MKLIFRHRPRRPHAGRHQPPPQTLDELTELLVLDGLGEVPDELDFYECRFNKAFRTLRIDAVRRAARRRKGIVDFGPLPPSEAKGAPDAYETRSRASTPSRSSDPGVGCFPGPFLNAIEALQPDERDAVILVHVLGYEKSSEDPNEETAATRCNCTGRTIRNRLTRAAAKLAVSRRTYEPDPQRQSAQLKGGVLCASIAQVIRTPICLDNMVRRYPEFGQELTEFAIALAVDALRDRARDRGGRGGARSKRCRPRG